MQVTTFQFPNNFQCNRVDFYYTRVVTQVNFCTIFTHSVWNAITSPTTVVEDQDVTFTWQTFWNHVAVMLTDDLADFTQFFAYSKVRTDLPYDFTGFFADDCHDICFTSIPDDVVWMESFVALVIPFVWPQYAHCINVHPVTHFTVLSVVNVRVSEQCIFCSFGEAQVFKVFVYRPFPNDVAFPVYFDDGVIQQTFISDTFVVYIGVSQNQGVTAVCFWFHTRYIVTYWVPFTLVIMVLTSHPFWFMTFVFDQFFFIPFPYYVAIPV